MNKLHDTRSALELSIRGFQYPEDTSHERNPWPSQPHA